MSGVYVRKVQKIGGQNIVNIPRAICAHLKIERGDLVLYTEIEDNVAIIMKMDREKLDAFKRQEALGLGKGKDSGSKGDGAVGDGKDGKPDGGDSDRGGNKGAEGGDTGQAVFHNNAGNSGDSRTADGSGEVAGDAGSGSAKGGDNNTGMEPGGTDKRQLIDEDAGPIDGNVIE